MKRKTLLETNPYLRDPKSYAKQLVASVASSTAIEIGPLKPSLMKALTAKSKTKKLIVSSRAKRSS